MFKLTKEDTRREVIESRQDDGIQHVQESSDLSQTIKEFNEDILGKDKMSSIDMKSRLHPVEISSIIAVDSLVTLNFLPSNTSFITRSKKRLSVSQNGEGRKEVVQIAQGVQQQSNGTNMFEKMGNWFKGGNNG